MSSVLAVPLPATLPSPRGTAGFERRLAVAIIASGLLLLALAWGSVAMVLKQKRDDALAAEVRQNTNLVSALEEQTLRVIAATDQATLRLRDAVAGGGAGLPDLARFANETGLAPGILVQLSLVGPDGRFAGSNLDPDGSKTGHVDLAAREHVRVHLAPASLPPEQRLVNPDALFIGKPVLGKVSGKWTTQLSRRIVGRDGALLGVVVASLDPAYFEAVFRRVSLGRGGSVVLLGTDRVIRARVAGGASNGLGTAVAADGPFAREATGTSGHFSGRSSVDGVERMFAYRRVADYPLVLLVSTATDEALEDWRASRNVAVILTLLLSAAVAAGAAVFVVSLRRLERTAEALRVSEAQAQAANQAKSEFLAAISHELRTPLTSIRGFAELMELRLDQPKFREQAGLIRKAAEYLNELLTQILDLAKVEAGAMHIEPEAVDLRALLRGSTDFYALSAADKGLPLALRVADEVPAQVSLDPLRVKQVLNNLLSNAIKFTDRGSVAIEAEVAGGELRVHVVDTGLGIDPAQHELIFERFRQGDARVRYQHGGTGLGLALSRALAGLMGGRLTVDSRRGEGARFTLALPLAR